MSTMQSIESNRHDQPEPRDSPASLPAESAPAGASPSAAGSPRATDPLTGWSQAMDVARRDDQTASKYVRLSNDGDQVTLMLRQVPFGYFAHRLGGENGRFAGWERCTGNGCAHCARGSRAAGRYLVDVLDVEARTRRLWEPSKTTFRALEAVARRFPPHLHIYDVTRHGRAGDTGTRYQILPAGPVTPELRAVSDKLPFFDLDAESWGESRRPDDDAPGAALPF